MVMAEDNRNELISIICPSPKGKEIAFNLFKKLNAVLYIKLRDEDMDVEKDDNIHVFSSDFKLNDVTERAMEKTKKIIFISSTGIAVRAIAPFIHRKDIDPGVVVVDLWAKHAISLLSGHLGGGNELALDVCHILNCNPVITTATDGIGVLAPDMLAKKNDLIIDDLKTAKYIAVLLVDNKSVGLKDDCEAIQPSKGYVKVNKLENNSVWITDKLKFEGDSLDKDTILKLIRKDIILGIGCRRDTPYEKINAFVRSSLEKYNFDIRAVSKIVSVDVKKNEQGIIDFAESLNLNFETFERDMIKTVQDKYDKSEFVFKTLGITGVCEPSVDLGGGNVIVSKIKHEGMTLAIGRKREFEIKTEE